MRAEYTKKIVFLTLLFLAGFKSFAQTDTIFWFAAPAVIKGHGDGPVLLRLSNPDASNPVNVNISMPAAGASDPIAAIAAINNVIIPPGGSVSVDLTPILNQSPTPGLNKLELDSIGDVIEQKGIRLQSTGQKFTAYYENLGSGDRITTRGSNAELMALKGQNAFGTEFYTPFQTWMYNDNNPGWPNYPWYGYGAFSAIDIVATDTGQTVVTIYPTQNVKKRGIGPDTIYPAGTPYTITLNQGETYSVVADTNLPGAHLNGTRITSTKKIAVDTKDDTVKDFNFEHNDAGDPSYANYDLIADQIIPTSVIGKEYIVVRGELKGRENPAVGPSVNTDVVVVVATQNGTQVTVDGVTRPRVLNAGETDTIHVSNRAAYVTSNNDIYVMDVTGFDYELSGTVLPPIVCTGSRSVTFVRSTAKTLRVVGTNPTVYSNNPPVFEVNLLFPVGTENAFTLNGAPYPIPASALLAVPGTTQWYAAHLDLSNVIDSGEVVTFQNSLGYFHAGMIDGEAELTSRYGYFSDFNKIKIQIEDQPDVCFGEAFEAHAGKGFKSYEWSNSATFSPLLQPKGTDPLNDSLKIISSGNYYIRVSSGPGCDAVDSFKVDYRPKIDLTLGKRHTMCRQTDTYKIDLSNSVNPSDFSSFTWEMSTDTINPVWSPFNNPPPTPTQSSIIARQTGYYRVTAIHNNGCKAIDSVIVSIGATQNISYTMPSDTSICTNGAAIIGPLNPGSTYNYTWQSPPIGLSDYNAQRPNTGTLKNYGTTDTVYVYNLSVVDPKTSCFKQEAVHVTVHPIPQTTASSNQPICAGSDLNLNSSAGNPGATYAWTGPNNFSSSSQNPTISAATTAASGTYTIILTENGCPSPAQTVSVVVNPIPSTTASSNQPICAGNDLNLSSSAGNPGASYSWTGPNSFSSTFQNPTIPAATTAATGTYTVILTENNCPSPAKSVIVTVKPTPSTAASSNQPICAGSDLNLSSSAGNPGASYSWTGPNSFSSTSQNPTIPAATTAATGTYTVILTENGCPSPAQTVSVVVNPIPSTAASSNQPICAGSDLNLSSSAGNPGASYSWTGPNSFSSTSQNPTIPTATTAATGTYTVILTENNCPSPAQTVNVVVNPIPTTTASSNQPICAESDLNLSSSAGNAGASYSWTGPNSFSSTSQNPTIPAATTAATGTYTVILTENNCPSPPATVDVIVNPLPQIVVATQNPSTCTGTGTATITITSAAGNYDVDLDGNGSYEAIYKNMMPDGSGSILIENLPDGTIVKNVKVRSVTTGCQSHAFPINNTITAPGAPVNTTDISQICADGISKRNLTTSTPGGVWSLDAASTLGIGTIDVSGAPVFNVANISGTAVIAYTLNGCTSIKSIPIIIKPTTVASGDSVCVGSTINLTSTAGAAGSTYSWSGPNGYTSPDQNPTIPNATTASNEGTYAVILTQNGCPSDPSSVMIKVYAIPPTTTTSSIQICDGDQLKLTSAAGGPTATYSWSGPNGFTDNRQNPIILIADLTMSGPYHVVLTENKCSSGVGTINVTVNPIPVTTASSNSPICVGDSIKLTSTKGGPTATYSWTGPNSFSSSLQNPFISNAGINTAGTYSVILTENNCSSPASPVTVTVNALPATTASSNSAICEGNTLTLTSSTTGAKYIWSGPDSFTSTQKDPSIPSTKPEMSGTYTIELTDANGCKITATTLVKINKTPSLQLTDQTICNGDQATLAAVTDAQTPDFDWSPDPRKTQSIVVSPNSDQTYPVKVTDLATNCADSTTVKVFVRDLPKVFVSDTSICQNQSVTVSASTDISSPGYSWNSGNGNRNSSSITLGPLTSASDTIVTVTVKGIYCENSANITVTVNPKPTVSVNSDTICIGSSITLSATPPGNTYNWSNSKTGQQITETPPSKGTYTYTVVASNLGCNSDPATSTVFVAVPPSVVFSKHKEVTCFYDNGPLALTSPLIGPDYTNTWEPVGKTGDSIHVSESDTYVLTVTNQFGCAAMDSVKVEELCEPTLFVPKAFTPNGDGINDSLGVFYSFVKDFEIIIFNRWGEIVYKIDEKTTTTNTHNKGHNTWDGTYRNENAPFETYPYIVKYNSMIPNDPKNPRTKRGSVTIVR